MGKIFIAEDDPLMVRMYERVFRLNGYEVEMAFDGEEAIAKLLTAKENPMVILLDIMMPKMSGFDVLKEIKANAKLKKIPVVILTNLAGQADAESGLRLGAEAYLVKSEYEPKEVVEKIKQIIEKYSKGKGK